MSERRRVLSLDGIWEIAEGSFDVQPEVYVAKVPVPGVVDLAVPEFDGPGARSSRREAFWYRTTFVLDGPVADIATLRIGRAAYGTKVFVNGRDAGEHLPNFTPGLFDIASHLLPPGQVNELVVRVGAAREDSSPTVANGYDIELTKSMAGLYDSVSVTLTGLPHIQLVRTRPNIEARSVTVVATVVAGAEGASTTLDCVVAESDSSDVQGVTRSPLITLEPFESRDIEVTVQIADVRLWSPEDPFLYELLVSTSGDECATRFGMRSFTFDPELNRALLNGQVYFLRGGLSGFFRALEDPQRTDQLWREDWVRKLFRQFKAMHFNTIRNALGFPPELWYRIADEEGMLVIDEFPLFYAIQKPIGTPTVGLAGRVAELSARWKHSFEEGVPWPEELTADGLTVEYREWVEDRHNHPCVVAWSAQCETYTPHTGEALERVRPRDLQGRPWSNGYEATFHPNDYYDTHFYAEPTALYRNEEFGPPSLARKFKQPQGESADHRAEILSNPGMAITVQGRSNTEGQAVLTSEFGWLWLKRDGSPAILSTPVYERMAELGWPVETAEERFEIRARILACQTEWHRAHRAVTGILLTMVLANAHPRSYTSDYFTDFDALEFEPQFFTHVRDAFSPVGVMVDLFATELPAGMLTEIPVSVVNDTAELWDGRVRLTLRDADTVVWEGSRRLRVAAVGQDRTYFYLRLPDEAQAFQLEARLTDDTGREVRSLRDFRAVPSSS